MTVGELIKALKKIDKDKKITIDGFQYWGEDYYDKEIISSVSKSHLQQRSMIILRQLPDPFTREDIDKAFGYNGVMSSINSRVKRLQDDGLIQKIRTGEDKGKFRKLI